MSIVSSSNWRWTRYTERFDLYQIAVRWPVLSSSSAGMLPSSPSLSWINICCRRPSLARRVRHLYVRPGFLPGMGAPIPPNPSRYRDIKGKWSLLHGRLRSLCSRRRGPVQAERVLTLAQAAIHRCGNIRELTIVLHDLSISPSFAMFLKSSWTCLAAHLRKLTIDVTLAKLPLIWEESESCRLPALEELEVSLAYSRVSCHDGQVLINDVLLPFTTSHTRTLRSLIVSSALPLDWSPYFNGLGCFPLLQKLALVLTISSVTLSEPMALTRLIDNHRQTLRQFSVRKNYGYTSDIPHDSLYATWIADEFSMLVLPALETLEMGLWPNLPYRSPLRLSVIPPASSLVSLSIVDFVLYDVQVEAILDALYVGSDGSRRLQSLQISVLFLHPHLVDLLATKLPGLKFLDLTFEHLAASTSVTINCRYVSSVLLSCSFLTTLTGRRGRSSRQR